MQWKAAFSAWTYSNFQKLEVPSSLLRLLALNNKAPLRVQVAARIQHSVAALQATLNEGVAFHIDTSVKAYTIVFFILGNSRHVHYYSALPMSQSPLSVIDLQKWSTCRKSTIE